MKDLTSWLDFWHFRYEQWRSHISKVLLASDDCVDFGILDCGIAFGPLL